jgi:hypothetical protein
MSDLFWKQIEEYPNYSVSNTGLIKNNTSGRILKQTLNKTGYYFLAVAPDGRKGKTKCFRVHREVAKAFVPNPDNLPQVNHKDGIKIHNHVDNLEWCTASHNIQHAVDTGLKVYKRGEDCTQSVLTEEFIAKIRSMYIPRDKEFGLRALADKFGMKHNTLSNALNGNTWKHIKEST